MGRTAHLCERAESRFPAGNLPLSLAGRGPRSLSSGRPSESPRLNRSSSTRFRCSSWLPRTSLVAASLWRRRCGWPCADTADRDRPGAHLRDPRPCRGDLGRGGDRRRPADRRTPLALVRGPARPALAADADRAALARATALAVTPGAARAAQERRSLRDRELEAVSQLSNALGANGRRRRWRANVPSMRSSTLFGYWLRRADARLRGLRPRRVGLARGRRATSGRGGAGIRIDLVREPSGIASAVYEASPLAVFDVEGSPRVSQRLVTKHRGEERRVRPARRRRARDRRPVARDDRRAARVLDGGARAAAGACGRGRDRARPLPFRCRARAGARARTARVVHLATAPFRTRPRHGAASRRRRDRGRAGRDALLRPARRRRRARAGRPRMERRRRRRARGGTGEPPECELAARLRATVAIADVDRLPSTRRSQGPSGARTARREGARNADRRARPADRRVRLPPHRARRVEPGRDLAGRGGGARARARGARDAPARAEPRAARPADRAPARRPGAERRARAGGCAAAAGRPGRRAARRRTRRTATSTTRRTWRPSLRRCARPPESLVGYEFPVGRGLAAAAIRDGRPLVATGYGELSEPVPHDGVCGLRGRRRCADALERRGAGRARRRASRRKAALHAGGRRRARGVRRSRVARAAQRGDVHAELAAGAVQRGFYRIASVLGQSLSRAATLDAVAQAAAEALGGSSRRC